jgi:hypothetical protein
MMLWMRFAELSLAAWQEFVFGPPQPEIRPVAQVISLSAERAKRSRAAVRAL